MGNRMLKDSIRTSKSVNALSDFQFRVWVYLITYVDDYGRGSADPELLKGLVFPRRKGVTESQICSALEDLANSGMVNLYEVDGEPYFCFPNWSKHQRIQTKKSKFPEPPEEVNANPRKSTVNHGESPPETETKPKPETEIETKKDDVDDAREEESGERHDLGTVMTLYMDHIQANPPPVHIDTLKSYVQSMGAEVVEHAITKALDANALNFSYVRTVLQSYAAKKVTTLSQAKQVDQEFMESKQRGRGYGLKGKNAPASGEPQKINIDELRAVLDKI